jgi:hypothetical protein
LIYFRQLIFLNAGKAGGMYLPPYSFIYGRYMSYAPAHNYLRSLFRPRGIYRGKILLNAEKFFISHWHKKQIKRRKEKQANKERTAECLRLNKGMVLYLWKY